MGSRAETLRLAGPLHRLIFNANKYNKAMKNSFLGILVLSHVISISVVIGSEEESNENGKFHEEAEFGVDAFEDSDEEKPETKAHYAPSQSYYILNDQQKTASFSPSTINSKLSAKQRPNSKEHVLFHIIPKKKKLKKQNLHGHRLHIYSK